MLRRRVLDDGDDEDEGISVTESDAGGGSQLLELEDDPWAQTDALDDNGSGTQTWTQPAAEAESSRESFVYDLTQC